MPEMSAVWYHVKRYTMKMSEL